MFNNKFLKHDPLLEAVKSAQAEGTIHRQAEAQVNEEFGVYSRKAVIRENLAAYDARLAEIIEEKKADKDYDRDGKIESGKAEYQGSRIRAAKAAGKLEEGPVDAGSMEGSKSVTKSAPKEDPSLPKSYPGAASSAPTAQRLSNAKAAVSPIKEEEQIDELNKSTVRSYVDKSMASMTAAKSAGFKKDYSEKKGKKAEKARGTFVKRSKGMDLASKKLDEAKYSAKAARAGADIGKPGKQFAKIAAKAGEKYGSEEKGKKVAGAILAKIRAKHMKESAQLDEIVTKDALAKSGLSLRDYMNKQQGLTRREPANNPGLKSASPAFLAPRTASATPAAKEPGADASAFVKSQGVGVSSPAPETKMASDAASIAKQGPVTSPVSGPGSTATASASKKKEAGALPTVAESVQVGGNKYRIV